jgi:hypothetical protein
MTSSDCRTLRDHRLLRVGHSTERRDIHIRRRDPHEPHQAEVAPAVAARARVTTGSAARCRWHTNAACRAVVERNAAFRSMRFMSWLTWGT